MGFWLRGIHDPGSPNLRLAFVQHFGTKSYRLSYLKHLDLLTLHSRPGNRSGVQNRAPRKVWVSKSKLGVPGYICPDIKVDDYVFLFYLRGGDVCFFVFLTCQLTSQKKINFAIRHFQKTINLTIDRLSLGIYAPSPQVLTYRPQILRGVRI